MAKILKQDADFAKRVEAVFQFMEEQGVAMEICCDSFRIYDTKNPDKDYLQNMELVDIDNGRTITRVAPNFEYALKVFDT